MSVGPRVVSTVPVGQYIHQTSRYQQFNKRSHHRHYLMLGLGFPNPNPVLKTSLTRDRAHETFFEFEDEAQLCNYFQCNSLDMYIQVSIISHDGWQFYFIC